MTTACIVGTIILAALLLLVLGFCLMRVSGLRSQEGRQYGRDE